MAELKGRHPKDCTCPSHTVEGQKAQQQAYEKSRSQQPKRMNYWHNKKYLESQRKQYKVRRLRALLVLAQIHGDDFPRCRIDLTPGTPVSDLPHRGKLTIDHIYGGGSQDVETSDRLVNAINTGRVDPTQFRVLCQLHQLWNTIDSDELFRRPTYAGRRSHASRNLSNREVRVRRHRRRA